MTERKRIVIIGGGFGGLWAAKGLANKPVDVTLIDRRNHHLFQPLLYQVATAVLAPGEIAQPLRGLLGRHRNVRVLLGELQQVDPTAKVVRLKGGDTLSYHTLVLATGATHTYFGHPEWERFAPGLKSLQDARRVRENVLLAFEQAERSN